ncbi:inositol monophosphatase family protein [Micromonospora cathayae]|uniref:Inositol-1-monophosphatase n=1 Tax=Micromonospora cathayae TaxID=3028804 RepID=A0ABY7ZXI4_9ACTN|nr:inositol monophosphatase family protein [Micromonospora sp. HUAS 3]WDZ87615.1 inositol monophosphatase family protein [Micromonospora sp. HUAS 3]
MNSATPGELLEIAIEVARSAAETAHRMRGEGVAVAATKSTATDVVTAADRAVERQVTEHLRRLRPYDAILGEEYGEGTPASTGNGGNGGAGSRTGAGTGAVRWIVDPIDGTVNYLYGLPYHAVSLAAEVDGTVVAGVVRNIATGDEWTATRGGGAYRSGQRLRCSTETDLGQALIGTGFGYDAARRAHQARVIAGLITEVRDIRRYGAAALDLCQAAEGRVDAYYEKGLGAWDLAAGGLVAAEAGLRVTGLRGRPAGPDLVLAAPPALYQALHDRLADLDASGGP